jgi:hypothetical protein
MENGAKAPDVGRKLVFRWKNPYEHLGVSGLREFPQLR